MSEKAEPTKSLARLVKKEIITQKISSDCCRRAFLAAVSRGAGSFYINSDDYGVTVSAADHELIQKCVSFVRHFTSTEPVVKLHTYTNKLGPDELYEFDLKHSDGVLDKLVSLGILPRASELDAPSPQFIIEKNCCKIAYLMGAFVASGTLSVPKDDEHSRSSGYYMGFNCSSESGAKFLSELIGGFGTEPKFRKRGEVYSVYFKDAESISDMLTRMHAVTGMLELQNIILMRQLKNNSNRYSNCEAANISKTVNAALKQIEAIEKLKSAGVLETLDDTLKKTACLRLDNPDATLKELGELLPGHPNRGAVNHRLSRLVALAEELKDKNE